MVVPFHCLWLLLVGVTDVHVCAHRCLQVCRWSQEKSTAGLTLISGVILSSSPQGCVAEADYVNATGPDIAGGTGAIHTRLKHMD